MADAGSLIAVGDRPRILDLFCGGGGAGTGYARAGFDVLGIDIKPQPDYPFEFVQGDAFDWLDFFLKHGDWPDGDRYAAIHAAPMWLQYAKTGNAHALERTDDVTAAAERLRATGLPYVCESGTNGPLTDVVMFCGVAAGLEIVKHMFFEVNWPILVPPCSHPHNGTVTGELVAYGAHSVSRANHGRKIPPRRTMREWKEAADLEWMTHKQAALASPPAYTEIIGAQLFAFLHRQVAA